MLPIGWLLLTQTRHLQVQRKASLLRSPPNQLLAEALLLSGTVLGGSKRLVSRLFHGLILYLQICFLTEKPPNIQHSILQPWGWDPNGAVRPHLCSYSKSGKPKKRFCVFRNAFMPLESRSNAIRCIRMSFTGGRHSRQKPRHHLGVFFPLIFWFFHPGVARM